MPGLAAVNLNPVFFQGSQKEAIPGAQKHCLFWARDTLTQTCMLEILKPQNFSILRSQMAMIDRSTSLSGSSVRRRGLTGTGVCMHRPLIGCCPFFVTSCGQARQCSVGVSLSVPFNLVPVLLVTSVHWWGVFFVAFIFCQTDPMLFLPHVEPPLINVSSLVHAARDHCVFISVGMTKVHTTNLV